jgi:hypothetical protein
MGPHPQPAGWRKPPSSSSPPAPSPAAVRGQSLATRPAAPLPSPGPVVLFQMLYVLGIYTLDTHGPCVKPWLTWPK